jgi:tetratricopeptide (TPR) repeat protein
MRDPLANKKFKMSKVGDPTYEHWLERGNHYYKTKEPGFEKAFFCYEQALKVGPTFPEVHYNLGLMYLKGKFVERDAKKAISYFYDGALKSYQSHKGALESKAINSLMEAYNIKSAKQWNDLGNKYLDDASTHCVNYKIAKKCFESAIKAMPNHPEANYNLGIIYYEGLGVPSDKSKGRDYFKKSRLYFKEKNIVCEDSAAFKRLPYYNFDLFSLAFFDDKKSLKKILNMTSSTNRQEMKEKINLIKCLRPSAPGFEWYDYFAGGLLLTTFLAVANPALGGFFGVGASFFTGAKVAKKNLGGIELLHNYDIQDWTLLHFAAAGGAVNVAKCLIRWGADQEVKVGGYSYLDIAKGSLSKQRYEDFYKECTEVTKTVTEKLRNESNKLAGARQEERAKFWGELNQPGLRVVYAPGGPCTFCINPKQVGENDEFDILVVEKCDAQIDRQVKV